MVVRHFYCQSPTLKILCQPKDTMVMIVVSLFLTKSPIEDSLAFRGSIADGHAITIIQN